MPDKTSFVLYTDYLEQIEMLSREQRGDLITAIFYHVSGMEIPELDGMTNMAFSFIRSRLDRDGEKYQSIVEKRREAGKKGGRPSKPNGIEDKAKKANGFSEKQTEAKKPDNDNVNDNDSDIKKKDSKESKEKAPRFIPPTRGEIATYCEENNLDVDADCFLDYYTSNGWKVGKNKMKDWKATLRNWSRKERQDNGRAAESSKSKFRNFEERDYDMGSLTRELLR